MTFSNQIESSVRVEGEIEYLSENISNDLRSEGSKKEGEDVGLETSTGSKGGEFLRGGGKSSRVKG